jgi:hypothetical protein
MDIQTRNFLRTLITLGANVEVAQKGADSGLDHWFINGFSSKITDENLLNDPEFAHLTLDKVTNAMSALQVFTDALGKRPNGQIINLIKLRP